ncbi:asparaginase domain-containing protein [Anaeropeptidivorans aminofermentans]|jgi:L-asparaginase|uniref:asparaginase domain-containing protein n=1 Tax=Anaeropeptidivorans aminofermentans TaxID=2934315 RepID=UPI000EBF6D84|nr:asparaginase domain-containing protein [Anaeropeptidivorans aminofermentans]MBE6013162.1 hypothetical protein [Lachnospiraceae bacterium]HAQ40650.1 hypothetical protein [Clostridiales bacterium]
MKNKVLVVETGGTFATSSISSIRTLSNYDNSKQVYQYGRVLERVEDHNIEFEIIRPIFTLSENLNMELLNTFLDAMYKVDFSKYKGVIITHGTDTLAYTANIISLLFSCKKVPIIFVSSNHPLDLPQSNGVDNFAAALDFIFSVNVQGVYVIYKNHEGKVEVHLGSRVKQMDQVVDNYDSFKNVYFGRIVNRVFVYNNDPLNPTAEEINALECPYKDKVIKLNKRVILIYPYVGMRHDFYNFSNNIDAVVYGVYHSGTFFTEKNYPDNSINKLIDKLAENNIPLFIAEISSQGDHYESVTNLASDCNVNLAYDISFENLYAKVLIGLELCENAKDINNFINGTNIFFEKIV